MQLTAEAFYKEVGILFIDDKEWYMTFVESSDYVPHTENVIEFQDRLEQWSPLFLETQSVIKVNDQGKGTLVLKDPYSDDTRTVLFEACLLVPFNQLNRAKKAIGAL